MAQSDILVRDSCSGEVCGQELLQIIPSEIELA